MKRTLISLTLILVLLVPIFSFAEQASPHLANDDELELTVKVMTALQNRMKDPDSFKIFEDVLFLGQYDGEWHFMVDAGARNSFGGMNRTYYYAVYSESNDNYVFLDTNDEDDLGDVATYMGKVADGLDDYIGKHGGDATALTKVVDKDKVMEHLELGE